MRQLCEYISGAANTVASSVCWTQVEISDACSIEIIAFCVDNLVAIVDVSKSVVTQTLRGHTGRINVLKSTKSLLISASEDFSIRIWNIGMNTTWESIATLSGVMRKSIIALSCLDIACGILIVASDVTGRVAIWLKGHQSDSFSVLQIIDMPAAQMPHDLHLTEVPGNDSRNVPNAPDVLLFIGSVDSRIHIRTASQQSLMNAVTVCQQADDVESENPADLKPTGFSVFNLVGVLAGHEEWVTCLSSVKVDNKTILLASGSKDSKIRLWRMTFNPCTYVTGSAQHLTTEFNKFTIQINDNDEDEDDDDTDATEGPIKLEPDESISEARLMFNTPCGKLECSIFFDALLIGHEDWVTSVHWMISDSDQSSDQDQDRNSNVGSSTARSDLHGGLNMNKVENHRLYSTSMDRYVCAYISYLGTFQVFHTSTNTVSTIQFIVESCRKHSDSLI